MGVLGDLLDWVRGGTDAGGTGSGGGGKPSGGGRREAAYKKCLNCGGEHIASALVCPGDGKRIRWAPDVATQATISTAAINVAIALSFAAGVVYFGVPVTIGRTAVAVGIGLVAANSSEAGTEQGQGTTTTAGTTPNGGLTNSVSGTLPGGETTTGTATTSNTSSTTPEEDKIYVRTGPFYASADTEGRLPKYMQVSGTSFTYTVEKDGKTWTNTMTWDGLPPEELKPGQEVHLTMNCTTQEGWANIGGWWNINCQTDPKGDASAGSPKNWRAEGGPYNKGDVTFKFQPSSYKDNYIQLSAGHDPAPDTWVLITYKYVPK